MIFNCGPTSYEKFKARQKWHKWFAWYPVRVGDLECCWLSVVERKFEGCRCADHRKLS